MKRYFIVSIFLLFTLSARDNPFVPLEQKPIEIQIPPKTKPIVPIKIESIEQIPIIKPIPIAKTIPIKEVEVPIAPKPKIILKTYKKPKEPTFIYNGEFAKISLHKNMIKITTKDKMLKHFKLTNPNRIVIDFERFDIVNSCSKTIDGLRVKGLKIGHHDYFYRASFKLNRSYNYKVSKKPYGYLISF